MKKFNLRTQALVPALLVIVTFVSCSKDNNPAEDKPKTKKDLIARAWIQTDLIASIGQYRDSLLALSGIPFAVAGGIWGLYVGGLHFSVSAAVGFISLFGVAAMDGILLVSYIRKNLEEQGMSREQSRSPCRCRNPPLRTG